VPARLRELTAGKGGTLDGLFFAVLEDNARWLREGGMEMAEETRILLEARGDL
jgi:hypothetical protein